MSKWVGLVNTLQTMSKLEHLFLQKAALTSAFLGGTKQWSNLRRPWVGGGEDWERQDRTNLHSQQGLLLLPPVHPLPLLGLGFLTSWHREAGGLPAAGVPSPLATL